MKMKKKKKKERDFTNKVQKFLERHSSYYLCWLPNTHFCNTFENTFIIMILILKCIFCIFFFHMGDAH